MRIFKRFLILFIAIIISTLNVNAQCTNTCDNTMQLTSPITRALTNALGMNFIAKQAAKSVIEKELNKAAPGIYTVDIDSYSALDLKNGKFRSLKIHGDNISSNGIYISSVDLDTLSPNNYIDYRSNPIQFKNDFPLSFAATISEDDLNKTLINMGYIKKLTDLNIGGISLFTIDNVAFKLKNNKIYLIAQMKAPFLMGERLVKFTFSGKLDVEDGKIVLDDVCSDNLRSINMKKFVDIINNMNPFDVPLNLFKGSNTDLSIKDVKIVGNKIYVDGTIVIKRTNNG